MRAIDPRETQKPSLESKQYSPKSFPPDVHMTISTLERGLGRVPTLRCFNLDTMDLKICCKKHHVLLIVGLARICSIIFLKFLDFPLTQGKMKIMLVILVQIRGVSEGFPIFGKIFRELIPLFCA